jgi:hypothetical protein
LGLSYESRDRCDDMAPGPEHVDLRGRPKRTFCFQRVVFVWPWSGHVRMESGEVLAIVPQPKMSSRSSCIASRSKSKAYRRHSETIVSKVVRSCQGHIEGDILELVRSQNLTRPSKRQVGGMEVERVASLAASCTLVRVQRCRARHARLVDRHRIRVCMGHMQLEQQCRTGRQGGGLRYYSSSGR